MMIAASMMMVGCGGGQKPPVIGDPSVVGDSSVVMESPAAGDLQSLTESAIPTAEPSVVSGAIRTMGKVVAARYADLSFETALPIERVFVRNGQQVRRGQVLVRLDQFKLRNAIEQQQRTIEQAQLQIEQAHLQMQDVIISQGYDPDKASTIPADLKHNADVKSGYALAKSQLATARTALAAAQHELRSGALTAPFDGVVANLSVQAHQLAQPGQTVCRVIATGDMEVEFRVMEADLGKYRLGTSVAVIPVADTHARYEAVVSEINPIVDEQGAVTFRARLQNAVSLFDGMNVEVLCTIDN